MAEHVTFFGDKGPEQQRRSQRLEIEDSQGLHILLAWTARTGRPLDDLLTTGIEYRDLVDEVTTRIRNQGGGILAEIQPASGMVRLHRGSTNGQNGIHQVIRLSPFDGAGDYALTREVEELRLGRGEHLLIPVSARAEERLLQLRELLGEMGPDVEALVLHTLRSPSTETRLDRLEEALEIDRSGSSTASWWSRRGRQRARAMSQQPTQTKPRRAARSRRRLGSLGLVLAVLVLGLLLVGAWFILNHDSGTGGTETTTTQPTTAPAEGTEESRQNADQPSAEAAGTAAADEDSDQDGRPAGTESPDTGESSGRNGQGGARR